MRFLGKIGAILDEFDGAKPEDAAAAEEESSASEPAAGQAESPDSQAGLGSALMGRGLDFLSTAAAAAGSAAAAAGSAAAMAAAEAADGAKGAVGNLGGVKSTLSSIMMAEGSDDEEPGSRPSPAARDAQEGARAAEEAGGQPRAREEDTSAQDRPKASRTPQPDPASEPGAPGSARQGLSPTAPLNAEDGTAVPALDGLPLLAAPTTAPPNAEDGRAALALDGLLPLDAPAAAPPNAGDGRAAGARLLPLDAPATAPPDAEDGRVVPPAPVAPLPLNVPGDALGVSVGSLSGSLNTAAIPQGSPSTSLASSARDIAAAGWSLEELPTQMNGAGALAVDEALQPAAQPEAMANGSHAESPQHGGELQQPPPPEVRSPAAASAAAEAAAASPALGTLAPPLDSAALLAPHSVAPSRESSGSTNSSMGVTGTSEEFTRCEVPTSFSPSASIMEESPSFPAGNMPPPAGSGPSAASAAPEAVRAVPQEPPEVAAFGLQQGLAPNGPAVSLTEGAAAGSSSSCSSPSRAGPDRGPADVAEVQALEAMIAALRQELASKEAAEAECQRLKALVAELTAKDHQRQEDAEAQLLAATQQLGRLQGRIDEVEDERQQLREQLAAAQRGAEEAQAALKQTRAAEASLEKQAEELRREVAKAQKLARDEAHREKEAILGEVRGEMEEELGRMLRQKDDQVRGLEAKIAAGETARRELGKELERQRAETEALQAEVSGLQQDGVGQQSDHQRKLDSITAEHRRRVDELEQRGDFEERQKHELALNLRSVEERARADLSRLEVEKGQLELQLASMQGQLQAEQQKCVDLSMTLGEAQQRHAQLEGTGAAPRDDEAALAREAEARELQARLQAAEDKLLESQSMRDMFGKETDMYRSELKVAREERVRLEEELARVQDRVRELQASQAQADPSTAQQSVIQIMQKDFDTRMERYRDEVQYLRQKCDEKERRCEQLLAERSSLGAELRAAGGGSGAWRTAADLDSGDSAGDLETGAKASLGKQGAMARSTIRSLPLVAPAWMRSADEPLRLVVKTLATYPHARLIFFGYVVLLHFWVLFVLQQQAVQGSSSVATPDGVADSGAAGPDKSSGGGS